MITDRAANPQFTKKSEAQHDNRHNHHGADDGQPCLMRVGDAGLVSVFGRSGAGLGGLAGGSRALFVRVRYTCQHMP